MNKNNKSNDSETFIEVEIGLGNDVRISQNVEKLPTKKRHAMPNSKIENKEQNIGTSVAKTKPSQKFDFIDVDATLSQNKNITQTRVSSAISNKKQKFNASHTESTSSYVEIELPNVFDTGSHNTEELGSYAMTNFIGKKKYVCDMCNQNCGSKQILIVHINLFHNEDKLSVSNIYNEAKPFACKTCNRTYTAASHLRRHMIVHSGKKKFICNECNKAFTLPDALKRHSLVHTEKIKQFPCQVCPKVFVQASYLRHHMQLHKEAGAKSFICNICNKALSTANHLRTHMRIHTGEKPYTCSQCDMSFNVACTLKTHMRTHTGEKPYVCNSCTKVFRHSCNLNKHVQEVHNSGEKPHPCNECGRAFSTARLLKTHESTHTKEKPFACSMCSNKYTRGHSLKQHILKIHTTNVPSIEIQLENDVKISNTEQKPFICTECNEAFYLEANFTKHMQIHSREKQYGCSSETF